MAPRWTHQALQGGAQGGVGHVLADGGDVASWRGASGVILLGRQVDDAIAGPIRLHLRGWGVCEVGGGQEALGNCWDTVGVVVAISPWALK